MAEGARFPTAEAVARAWLLAARRRGETHLLGRLASGRLALGDEGRLGLWLESRWVLFQALRAAFPDLLWEETARMCGFPEGLDFGEWSHVRRMAWWDWRDVAPVFAALADDAA